MPDSNQTDVTILSNNLVQRRELLAEHGLSYWIQHKEKTILFDTGQGMVFEHNARKLNIDLQHCDVLVLSHGHYDHTGGVSAFLGQVHSDLKIYYHGDVMQHRYNKKPGGEVLDIGISNHDKECLQAWHRTIKFVKEPTEIIPDLFATGPVPRNNDFETIGKNFFLNKQCTRHDDIFDDQSLYLRTDKGIVVLLGCAHAGVINTLHYIRHITEGGPIRVVMGGMHLKGASKERIEKTIEALRELNIPHIGPCHCTGIEATEEISRAFPEQCFFPEVGGRYQF
jgi:7,8-dihydropterin-6-yl-methyl-4-(beta-D-ribofuranosyl)aminobenzene 5'-phosphate synthase